MKCLQKRERCVFNRKGKCDILTDTFFSKPCPFYKEALDETVRDMIHEGETFRSIRGYSYKYFVSESGRVINWQGREIRQSLTAGKPYVNLTDQFRGSHKVSVARLVVDAFIPGTGRIGHKDRDLTNCERWNLYIVGDEDGK